MTEKETKIYEDALKVHALKKAFIISVAMFEMMNTIQKALGGMLSQWFHTFMDFILPRKKNWKRANPTWIELNS